VPGFRYVVGDVFTDTPLTGNPLAVFTNATGIPDVHLLPLTRELRLSETAFVYPPEDGGHARIRIFTPSGEIPFAGHPVLGTAFVLAGPMQLEEIRLETGSGLVPVALSRDAERLVEGRMTQPLPTVTPLESPSPLFTALGVTRSSLPVDVYDNGVRHALVALAREEDVAALEPDLGAIAWLVRDGILPAAGVSCFAGSGTSWKTRMFAPSLGVPEDPATGSAAGPIACHLGRHGVVPFGDWIELRQGEELARPSILRARATAGRDGLERVEVGGCAVIVARGEFRL
jgi:trans-2,3-dihydro-3-hydroxyanthranilate isomerase